jgi:hypothetical protein
MNQTFNKYMTKVGSAIKQNPIKKAFNLLNDFLKLSKLTEKDLKKAVPISYKEVMDFRKNFKEAVSKDMRNIEKEMSKKEKMTGESFNEEKNVYNEKFDFGALVYVIPASFYIFVFLLFIGDEAHEKVKNYVYNFLDKTLGPHIDDPEIRQKNKKD